MITSFFRWTYLLLFGPAPTLARLLEEDLHHAERDRLTSITKEEELRYKLACQALETQHRGDTIARLQHDLAAARLEELEALAPEQVQPGALSTARATLLRAEAATTSTSRRTCQP